MPNSDVLARIVYEVMHSREDAQACVRWQNNEVRKFRDKLYLLSDMTSHDASITYQWSLENTLEIPTLNISLTQGKLVDFGVKLSDVDCLSVRFRQGGEAMRPRGRGCQKDLKSLFQEADVEPWLRDRIPLLFHNEQLIFVWGYWIQEGY